MKNGKTCAKCNYSLLSNGFCSNELCENAPRTEKFAITMDELDKMYPKLELFHGRQWGSWQLNAKTLTLQHEHYEVDLERIGSSASMLDWIYQVKQKTWADQTVMYDLLSALHDIFDPQATLCSFCDGESLGKTIKPTEFLKKRIKKIA